MPAFVVSYRFPKACSVFAQHPHARLVLHMYPAWKTSDAIDSICNHMRQKPSARSCFCPIACGHRAEQTAQRTHLHLSSVACSIRKQATRCACRQNESTAADVYVLVFAGVSGSGKSTVGQLCAARLGLHFEDADDYHSLDNIAKMRSGIPLTDEDRHTWLSTLQGLLQAYQVRAPTTCIREATQFDAPTTHSADACQRCVMHGCVCETADKGGPPSQLQCKGCSCVLACSALKPEYRAYLSGASSNVLFILLDPPHPTLQQRMERRSASTSHFMPASLLGSQLQTLAYMEDDWWLHVRANDSTGEFPSPDCIVDNVVTNLQTAQLL